MTLYALNDKDEELGFVPIDFLGYAPKGKKLTHLYPQERNRINKESSYLARIERDFAGLEPIQKPILINTTSSKLEQKLVFE